MAQQLRACQRFGAESEGLSGRTRGMAAACGHMHTAAVGEDGTLYAWGSELNGRLGSGQTIKPRLRPMPIRGLPAVAQVATGLNHTAIVTDAGDLLLCGQGAFGQLGLDDNEDRLIPTHLDRALFNQARVMMVACGFSHTVALAEGGDVYTFGFTATGGVVGLAYHCRPLRLPTEHFNCEQIVLVDAGNKHTVAVSEEGHVFTWGDGGFGNLGHNDRGRRNVPMQVDPARLAGDKVVFVATGEFHTMAVTARGQLYSWGYGAYGQLGHGDTVDRLVPTLVGAGVFGGAPVTMTACGACHSMVVTRDGALWACGLGSSGQLGLSDRESRWMFVRVDVARFDGARVVTAAVGVSHSAAVTEGGALWSWGGACSGILGHNDEVQRPEPTLVAASGLGALRFGRCRELPVECALAFAMGTHDRLGSHSPLQWIAGEEGLLSIIAGLSRAWPVGPAGRVEGVVRLCGGGLMLADGR